MGTLFVDEFNQVILSRHILESLICMHMFIIGWKHRTILPIAYLGKESLDDTFDKRLYSYHPSSQNVLVIFTAFQIKNLYDAIVFNDGPEFLAHHIASLFCSIGALFNRVANCYSVFFTGIS